MFRSTRRGTVIAEGLKVEGRVTAEGLVVTLPPTFIQRELESGRLRFALWAGWRRSGARSSAERSVRPVLSLRRFVGQAQPSRECGRLVL